MCGGGGLTGFIRQWFVRTIKRGNKAVRSGRLGWSRQGRWYYASSAAYWTKVHPPELSVSGWVVRAQATVPIKKRTLNAIEMNRAWWGPTINSGEGYVIEAMGLSSRNEVQRDGGTRTGSPKMSIMRRKEELTKILMKLTMEEDVKGPATRSWQ